jgi:Spy/CpxP family protein refolding chaperone
MKSKSLLSMMDDDLKKWRAGGRSERTYLLPTLAILAVILFGIKVAPPALFAQTGGPGWHRGPGPMGPEQELGWLSDKLELTDAQKSKIRPLLEDEHKQLTALPENTSLSREERQAKFKQIHTSTYDQINPILTEQQQATLKQLQQQRGQGMKARHQNGSDESAAPQSQ